MPEAVWDGDPTDFVNGQKVSADDMNEILGRLMALKDPESADYECDEASDYSTSSTSFVDVDDENLALTIPTNGGDVMIGFVGTFIGATNPSIVYLDIDVDGVRVGGDDGIIGSSTVSTSKAVISFVYLVTGLSAESHTFKLQWKRGSNNVTLYAGAGTSGYDLHPQFWAREVS